jgi:uncharacterized protein (TIGR02996 family)
MSDETALLAAIYESPHDDTPRLVLADWLQETGDPAAAARAEFVRVQCELARMDEDDPLRPGEVDLATWGMTPVVCGTDNPRRAELARREATLQRANAKLWKAGLAPKYRSAPYDRGFLAPRRQFLTAKKFLAFPPDELAVAPLWDFAMKYHRADFPKALASPAFQRIGRLELWADSVPPAGYFRALAESPNARNLSHVRPSYQAGDDGLLAVAGSPHLSNLTALQFAYQKLTPAGFNAALSLRKKSRPLRELYLRNNELDDSSVAAIGRAPWCAGLRALSLDENERITDAGVAELARSKVMKNLRYLSLSFLRRLTDRAATALAESPHVSSLRVLFLNHAGFMDKGAAALAASPHLRRLESLVMFDTRMRKAGAAAKALKKRWGEGVRF